METPADSVHLLLSLFVLLTQVFIGGVVLAVLFGRHTLSRRFLTLLRRNSRGLSFAVALVAMAGSLFYSEIAGYEPCSLCWYQRICMYPQVLLLGIAIMYGDRHISRYIIPLSAVGASISMYHYVMQIWGNGFLSCGVLSYSARCSDSFVMTFGYITIPLMAFTAFCTILILMALSRRVP